jgi:glutathione S-transferase
MSIHIVGVAFSNLVRSVLICCEEKNIPYTSGMTYQGQPIGLRSDELKALNPIGKIPVLVQDDFILSETQSILRYLDDQFATSLQGINAQQRALIDQWCAVFNHQTDLIFVRQYLLEFVFPKGENGQLRDDVVQAATPAVKKHLALLSAALGNKDYWVGDQLSLADLLLLPMLDYLLALPHGQALFDNAQNLIHYVEQLRLRPSCIKILQNTTG